MNKNDEIVLEISSNAEEGNGVGKYNGIVVFVPFTVAGDVINCKIVKVKKNYCFGKNIGFIKKSNLRIDTDCPLFEKCGGCAHRNISYETEIAVKKQKVADVMHRIGGIYKEPEEVLFSENSLRYRNKGMCPVSKSGLIGFYALRSHRVIPFETGSCLLQPKEFDTIVTLTENFIKDNNISCYDEDTKTGVLRHLYMRKAFATNELMVVLVVNATEFKCGEKYVDVLKNSLGKDLKTVLVNYNTKDTNVVLGEKMTVLYGSGYITDVLCGVKIRLSPYSFYQVNREMAEKLYLKVAEYAKPQGKTILDLYCGAGTIGLSMANMAEKVIGVEIVKEAIEDAKVNACNNDINNARFICDDALGAAQMLANENIKADIVIVDPPRKGCDSKLLHILAKDFACEKIVYVSCDPATLARDCAILKDFGYNVVEYTPVDLFPRTSHIETVALLSRQKVDEHIYFDVNVQDLPKTARTTATYPEIKAYVKEKYGLNVTSLNIAQIKEKHGFEKRENYNKGKDGHRVPNCPPEKEKAIEDAFKHFGML